MSATATACATPPITRKRRVVGDDGAFRDLAEREQTEEDVRWLAAIVATSDDAIISKTMDSLITTWNPGAERIYGYTAAEVIGRSIALLVPPDRPHELPRIMERLRRGERIDHFETVRVRKDGSRIDVSISIAPIVDAAGQIVGAATIARDISERVHAYQLLEQRVVERTHELSTVLKVSQDVVSTLELRPLLALILDHLKTVVDYTGATIFILEGGYLIPLDHRGPLVPEQVSRLRYPVTRAIDYQEICRHRSAIIVDDLRGDAPLACALREEVSPCQKAILEYARSVMVVPLMVKERIIGLVRIDHGTPHYYLPRHATLALALANQAAIAIENATLYGRAQEVAVQEERSRLARELHDSVTQMLFSANLIADVLPHLWERNQDDGRECLNELRLLTRGALADMRMLLLELRPAALMEAWLGDLLHQLAEVMTSRKRVPVTLAVEGRRSLPPDVHIALYRVAQEALNNVAKHADAGMVAVHLRSRRHSVELCISDDGRGFDMGLVMHNHFGLGIMRERAEAIGATLTIDSLPGRGTRIGVVWKDMPGTPGRAYDRAKAHSRATCGRS